MRMLKEKSDEDFSEKISESEFSRINLERLNILSAQSRSYTWEINTEGLFTYVSPVVEIVLGYKPEQLVGKRYFYDIVTATQREQVKREAFAIITQQISMLHCEKKLIKADGEEVWVTTNCKPLFNAQNRLTGYMGSDTDITEQKELQQKLQNALITAERSAKAKETFLTNMSHEIRTPLNVIIGMIREIGKESLSQTQKQYLKNAESSSYHLLSIVNNVLDMSKIEAGEFKLDIKDFSLSAVLSNVKSILSSRANSKSITFSVECTDNIARALRGDSIRLSQVLINLLGNSIKFTDKGFVKLTVDLVGADDESQFLRFEVSDSGIGMSESYLHKVFNKFSQENDASNRMFEGTGLGMSISKEIIELMGGVIDISSRKGMGTAISFTIQFPIGIEENLIKLDRNTRNYDISGKRILIVEDNEMNRFIARQSLLRANCVIAEAINGFDAIEILKQKRFDLVLMDIQMPEMDGVEATKHIRDVLHLTLPIVALTANAFKHDIDLYLQSGMNDFLIKPYKEEELFEKVEQITRKKQTKSTPDIRPSSPENNPATQLYSLNQIETISRGDRNFVLTMIAMFLKLSEETITNLNTAIQQNEIETIKRLAHKIKPSLENLNVKEVYNEIQLLESFNPVTETPEKLKSVVELVVRVLKEVNGRLRQETLRC